MIYFISTLIILIISALIVFFVLKRKLNKENFQKTKQMVFNILELRGFFAHDVVVINRNLSFAINKEYTKLAVIENFNPKYIETFSCIEIATLFIYAIEKNKFNIRVNYVKQGDKNTIYVSPINKQIEQFFYEIMKNENLKKLANKYPNIDFDLSTTSNWECEYTWAYSTKNANLGYYSQSIKPNFGAINLRNVHFTIDTKYNYLEAPLVKGRSQFLIYEPEFLDKLYKNIFDVIKQKTSVINKDLIYYDNYNNILYISNGTSTLQSLLLNQIDEVYYYENKLYFTLLNKEQSISLPLDDDTIKAFREFIVSYNLRKIALSFDYTTDKLINTTENTKLIIDNSRKRLVYCANLDKISAFTYMTIPFVSIKNINIEKYGITNFIRITTVNKEAIDITCSKNELAHYIFALINKAK